MKSVEARKNFITLCFSPKYFLAERALFQSSSVAQLMHKFSWKKIHSVIVGVDGMNLQERNSSFPETFVFLHFLFMLQNFIRRVFIAFCRYNNVTTTQKRDLQSSSGEAFCKYWKAINNSFLPKTSNKVTRERVDYIYIEAAA